MTDNGLCRFKDRCTKGDKCPFIHPKDGNTPSINLKPKKKCKDGDNCKYILNCRFDHSSSTVPQPTTTFQVFELVTK